MTIIYPVPELLPDGRARFIQILNTCRALAETGNRVILVAGIKKGYRRGDIFDFYGLTDSPDLEIVFLPMLRIGAGPFRFSWHGVFHLFFLLFMAARKLDGGEKDIVYVRHLKLAGFVMKFSRVLKVPVVFEAHEIFALSAKDGKKRKKLLEVEKNVYRKIAAAVSISESIKRYLAESGMRRERVYVIPDGVKKEWLNIGRESPGSYICYAGSLYPWKGVDILVSAMKYLPGETLCIVGGGSRLSQFGRLAEREGVADRVRFAGAVPHAMIPVYLSRAKVVVLPNTLSGPSGFSSPLKLFEYMASGIPIVASDLPVFREILRHGENALLCEPGDPEALAERIRRLCEDPELALRLGNAAKEDARAYTYEKRSERIWEVVNSVMKDTRIH